MEGIFGNVQILVMTGKRRCRKTDGKIFLLRAINGTVTVTFDSELEEDAEIADFTVMEAINDADATEVTPSAIATDGAEVELTVPEVEAGDTAKDVVYSVSYNDGDAVSADAFTVEAEEVPVDKSALETAIADAEDYVEADYTAESWTAFADALANAETVVADEEATQDEVDTAVADLNAAVEGLVLEVTVTFELANVDAEEMANVYASYGEEAPVYFTEGTVELTVGEGTVVSFAHDNELYTFADHEVAAEDDATTVTVEGTLTENTDTLTLQTDLEDGTDVTLTRGGEISAQSMYTGTVNAEGVVEFTVPTGFTYTVNVEGRTSYDLDFEGTTEEPVNINFTYLDAEAAVEEYEAADAPASYDEVEAVEELETAARDAVALVEDVYDRLDLEERIEAKKADIDEVLGSYVDAVNAADNQLDLYSALADFWTVDEDLTVTYWSLDTDTPEPATTTVHEIQENLVVAASNVSEAEVAFNAVKDAADSGSLSTFRTAMEDYSSHFENVNIDSNTVMQDYLDDISADLASDDIAEIQADIDAVNIASADAAVEAALESTDRADLEAANELLNYVDADDYTAESDALTAHEDILAVFEADTNAALETSLETIEAEYVYSELMAEYMTELADTDFAGTVDISGASTIAGANAEWVTAIQDVVNVVNNEKVAAILEDFATIDAETSATAMESILIELDSYTPIYDLDATAEVDFDLEDETLAFNADRLERYRDLATDGFIDVIATWTDSTTISAAVTDIEDAIKTGNTAVDAEFSHFEVADLEDQDYATDAAFEFTVNLVNKGGEAYAVTQDDIDNNNFNLSDVTVTINGETQTVTPNTISVGGESFTAATTTISPQVLGEIGTYSATLDFTSDIEETGKEYSLNADVIVTTDPVVNYSTVTANAEEYVYGDDITLEVTLRYGEDKVLTTANGEYPSVLTITDEASLESVYNRTLNFTNGVATITVPARDAEYVVDAETGDYVAGTQSVSVNVDDLLDVTRSVQGEIANGGENLEIAIAPGQITDLEAEFDDTNTDEINLAVTDGRNIVNNYEGEKEVLVTMTKVETEATATSAQPDEDGIAFAIFAEGTTTGGTSINLANSDLVAGLEAGEYEVTVELQELGLEATTADNYTVN